MDEWMEITIAYTRGQQIYSITDSYKTTHEIERTMEW